MPKRIRLRRVKGWRLPPGAVSVARPTRFGNPFAAGAELGFPFDEAFGPVVRDRAHAVEIFRTHARVTAGYEEVARRHLAGKDLACWCPLPAQGEPDICHAAVLLSIANSEPEPHDILPRHRTPETRDADGRRHITVQRCCNGCGEQIGDVTLIEIELAIAGAPLPDVRMECPQCRPTMDPPLAVVGKGESAQLEAHDD